MALADFWRSVTTSGAVSVPRPHAIDPVDAREVDAMLAEAEAAGRPELPGTPPDFNVNVARWALGQLYLACQFMAHSNIPAPDIERSLCAGCPSAQSGVLAYSADVALRPLLDIYRICSGRSPGDPVSAGLRTLGARFPLSSVGMPDLAANDLASAVSPLTESFCLMQLYVDRIISARDASRLEDPRVREAVRRAAGGFPELVSVLSLAPESTS